MYDLVGDKIQEFFDAQVVDIGIVDDDAALIRFPYTIERGVRLPDEPIAIMGIRKHVIETREPLLINERADERAQEFGQPVAIQGEAPKSSVFAPLIVGGEATGVISLQNLDHETRFQRVGRQAAQHARGQPVGGAPERPPVRRAAPPRHRSRTPSTASARPSPHSWTRTRSSIWSGTRSAETFAADIVYVALLDTERGKIDFPYYFETGTGEAPDSIRLRRRAGPRRF